MLLALALCLGLLPAVTLTAAADDKVPDTTTYPIWIGGEQVNENNRDKLSDNHWSYDPSTHTLTLSGYSYSGQGYNYSGSYYAGIYYNGADALTVSLSGENSVTQTKGWGDPGDCPIVIDSTAALTVAGSGSLTAQQGDTWNYGPAILSSGPITFSGGTVKAVGAYYNGIKAPSVTVKSTVTSVDVKGCGDSAKAIDGTLINELAGIGYNQWNQPTKIEANTTGEALTYRHVVFPIAQYTIVFDADGGSGSMDDVTVEEGESYELPSCGFDPPKDKKFNWWDVHGVDLIGTPGTPVVITSGCLDENGVVPIKAKWIDTEKAPAATIKTAPEAENLTYSSQGQTLVTAGEAEGGAIWYIIGENATDAPDSGWSKDIPEGTSVGTYYVWYKAVGDNSHKDSEAACCTAKIDKGTQTIVAENVTATYGDTDKSISATTDGDGAISYAVKDGSEDYIDADASTGALTIKKVPADGKAYVTVTAAETSSYLQATNEVTVTISKANAVPATVTANNRTYDKTEKPLVTVDESTLAGGKMQYALGTDATTAPTSGWSTAIPKATDIGTYYVWYKVVGDETHNDSEPASVEVKINTVDKTDLNKAIKAAKDYYDSIKDNSSYEDIAAKLKDEITKAEAVAANDNVTLIEVVAAEKNISVADAEAAKDAAEVDKTKAEAAQKAAEEAKAKAEAAQKAAEDAKTKAEAAQKAAEEAKATAEAAQKAAEDAAAQAVADKEAAEAARDKAEAAQKAAEAAKATAEAALKAAEEAKAKAEAAKAEAEAACKEAEERAAKAEQNVFHPLEQVQLRKFKVAGKKVTVKWIAVDGAKGYQVIIARNKKCTKKAKTYTVKGAAQVKKVIRKDKKGRYFVKVRAYKTLNGNTVYGKFSKVRKVRIK